LRGFGFGAVKKQGGCFCEKAMMIQYAAAADNFRKQEFFGGYLQAVE